MTPRPADQAPDGDRLRAVASSPPEPAQADPSALLRACGRGDEAAFAALYDATAPRVYGLVRRVVRDPGLSEEVTQEVYLEIWRTASRFDETRGSAISWLLTMAHRRAVDRVRASEASTRRDVTYEHRNHQVAHDSTSEAAHARLEARRVREALAGLTDVQRQAVELAYFGGYTHSEVAAMLELPLGTAKTRIRDALIRLRDTMGVGQ